MEQIQYQSYENGTQYKPGYTPDLLPAMEEAFALKDRLVFMDIHVDPDEHVYPMMVAPNGAMKDMWLSKTERT